VSVRPKLMQSLIANGEAAAHAQLHLEVIADAPDPAAPFPGQPLPPQIIGEPCETNRVASRLRRCRRRIAVMPGGALPSQT